MIGVCVSSCVADREAGRPTSTRAGCQAERARSRQRQLHCLAWPQMRMSVARLLVLLRGVLAVCAESHGFVIEVVDRNGREVVFAFSDNDRTAPGMAVSAACKKHDFSPIEACMDAVLPQLEARFAQALAQLAALVRITLSPAGNRSGGIWTERSDDAHVPARSLLSQPVRIPFDAQVRCRSMAIYRLLFTLAFLCSLRTGLRRSASWSLASCSMSTASMTYTRSLTSSEAVCSTSRCTACVLAPASTSV